MHEPSREEWDEGLAFLTQLQVSADEQDREIVRLVRELTDHWEASIGLVLKEPIYTRSFMRLTQRGGKSKRRVITELRKRLNWRRKEGKRRRQREIRAAHEYFANLPAAHECPIER